MENTIDPFELPITYTSSKKPLSDNLVADLELIDTADSNLESVYSFIFKPSDEESKKQCDKWSTYYTDDIDFLKDSQKLYRKYSPKKDVSFESGFIENWKTSKQKDTEDFLLHYHYIEYKVVEILNKIPMILLFLSLYSMMSPVMFLLSPLFMMFAPFIVMKIKQENISWDHYKGILFQMLKNHALGALFTGFNKSDGQKKMYILMSAIFFIVQIYYNIKSCYQFYRNISKIHEHIDNAKEYAEHSIKTMDSILNATNPLPTYKGFNQVLTGHKEQMMILHRRLDKVRSSSYSIGEVKQLGYLRALFYELRFCPKLHESITYCIGVNHYAANIQRIQALRKNKNLGIATFKPGPPTFKKAYHPLLMNSDPTTNSYKVDKNLLITGPNASGKTTFVKTTLINIIFTQQIGMGFYKKASILPYQDLLCYLNIPDTSGRDSLFQAEARRCKEIIDSIDLYPSRRTFCIFDELYSGTNPYEASASAYAFLKYLANRKNCTYLLTTHFIDVCDSLNSHNRIRNVHMHTTDKNNCIQYHYIMQRGISKVRGGLQVLQDLEYPDEIINMATTYSQKRLNDE
jgi:hypothetical protein